MSGPAETSLHEPKSDTCDISPTHNDCRRAEQGDSPAQSQRPRRSTDRPQQCRPYGQRHQQPVLGRLDEELLNYSILGLVWSRGSHFPRAGAPQDQSPGTAERYGCGRFGVRGRLRGPSRSPHRAVRLCSCDGDLAPVSQANASFPDRRLGP